MLKIDPWNIIWTVVNLLFLYWIFKKFLFDRVMGVINQRDEMIQKQFSEAKKSQDDAESLKSDYKKKLESAKTQADQISSMPGKEPRLSRRRLLREPDRKQTVCLKKQKRTLLASRRRQQRPLRLKLQNLPS